MAQLLFPARCPVCDRALPAGSLRPCPTCEKTLKRIPPKKIVTGHGVSGYAVFSYDSVKKSLYRFKYGNRGDYADYFAEEMANTLPDAASESIALFVPVPIAPGRRKERGYNQAALLARKLSEWKGIPCAENLLLRTKETPALSGQSPEKRRKIMQNAVAVNRQSLRNDVEWKTIYLVDDIFTTGATVDACAAALMAEGASKVCFVTVGATLREDMVFKDAQ